MAGRAGGEEAGGSEVDDGSGGVDEVLHEGSGGVDEECGGLDEGSGGVDEREWMSR